MSKKIFLLIFFVLFLTESKAKQLIVAEQNTLLNKFSTTHLEKSKKKYLIKFL